MAYTAVSRLIAETYLLSSRFASSRKAQKTIYMYSYGKHMAADDATYKIKPSLYKVSVPS